MAVLCLVRLTDNNYISNPEYELCLPLFRVLRPGLITLVLVPWIVSLRLGLSFTRLLQTVSTMIVQYTIIFTIFNRVVGPSRSSAW